MAYLPERFRVRDAWQILSSYARQCRYPLVGNRWLVPVVGHWKTRMLAPVGTSIGRSTDQLSMARLFYPPIQRKQSRDFEAVWKHHEADWLIHGIN